jgi:4'-phosphopantetheinyl transferase
VDDARLARAEAALAPAELARARRGTAAVGRRRILLRAALRAALGEELGVDPREVPLTAGPSGRPRLPAATDLDASASASGALGIVAVTRGARVGVDLEFLAPWRQELLDDVLDEGWLCPAERSALRRLPAAHRAETAARVWTQKEAVLKGRGTGLQDDPSAVVTTVGTADGAVAGWRVRSVAVPAGWVASLALAETTED